MIKIQNLSKNYGKNKVLDNINIHIKQGEIFAFLGHSGAGKSTLLRCINGLESYDDGSLKVEYKEVSALNKNELREFRKNIGMIFQHFALMSQKTAAQNIATPLEFWGYDKKAITLRVGELLELVGLSNKADFYPSQLSGGQKQRIAIARALALKPKILLSDEATSALDPNTTKQILSLLKKINEELGITIVLVTHEMDALKAISNRAALLSAGQVIANDDITELFLHPNEKMREFLGDDEILPLSGVNIRLYFRPNNANRAVITSMARELGIDFNIVWGKLERLDKLVLGSLVINIQKADLTRVQEYLTKAGVIYELA